MASLSLPPPRRGPTSVASRGEESIHASALKKAPHNNSKNHRLVVPNPSIKAPPPPSRRTPPSYESRCQAAAELARMTPEQRAAAPKLFVPRTVADFGDGGAYPEIHVAQFPRQMGHPHRRTGGPSPAAITNATAAAVAPSRALINVQVDQDGSISYDALVKRGTNADKIVYSKHADLVGGEARPQDVALPTPEEEQAEADRTRRAFEALLSQKSALDKPKGEALVNAETSMNIQAKTQFIEYTPRPDAPGYNPAAARRIIQMVPAQVDPMMPPKHRHIQAPRGPAEDPVPILHAPPTKLTQEEREAWNIPACISNWKNMRGYTIPLDKRLAADGRGLIEHGVNSDQFATLAESLYVAERQARQEVRMRAAVQQKLALQQQERREEELRQLAQRARLERTGVAAAGRPDDNPGAEDDDEVDDEGEGAPAISQQRSHLERADDQGDDARGGGRSGKRPDDDDDEDDSHDDRIGRGERQGRPVDRIEAPASTRPHRVETDEEVAARLREQLRRERRRERERDLRLEQSMEAKKRKLEEERDVSEKIALGVFKGPGASGADGLAGQVDARLYNQSAGMDSGFGADDDYHLYSEPLFNRTSGATSASIYRPTRGETEYNADEQYQQLKAVGTSKFQPDRGFAGAESGGVDNRAGPRTAPVQFEKA